MAVKTRMGDPPRQPRNRFQGQGNSSNLQISIRNLPQLVAIQFGDGQFTEAHRNLQPSPRSQILKKHALTNLIILLPRAEAVFNDYQTKKKSGPCFEGTRVELLREMANWVTGNPPLPSPSHHEQPTLGLISCASFFFSRDEADRNNAKLFTTIAYQLCVYDETFGKAIGDVLLTERGSAATTKDPQEQLQDLILDPLRSIV
ncbi:hypothetical protein JOM56_001853 [Amanita muscaria]